MGGARMTGAPMGTNSELKLPPEVFEGALLAGRYRIRRMLGSGAMGAVFAAEHVELRELVAIKVLLLDSAPQASADALSRFTREAWAASKIKSEYVARVNDLGRLEDGTPYIVMEYLDGVDLEGLLHAHGTLSVEMTVELMLQACEALAEAHVLGIFHRDLKPSNLFCVRRSDGVTALKLLDFGISKIARPASDSDPRLTLTAATLGTPLYMSPEQMRSGRIADERSDIWSLGVIMFELLTGRVPFNAQNLPDLAVLIATNVAPAVTEQRADVPLELSRVIACCLDKESSLRFANVAELARALTPFGPSRAAAHADRAERILQVVHTSRARITPVTSARSLSAVGSHARLRAVGGADTSVIGRPRWQLVAVSLVAAALLCALGFWALRRDSQPSAARPKETRANAALAPKPARDSSAETSPAGHAPAKTGAQQATSTEAAKRGQQPAAEPEQAKSGAQPTAANVEHVKSGAQPAAASAERAKSDQPAAASAAQPKPSQQPSAASAEQAKSGAQLAAASTEQAKPGQQPSAANVETHPAAHASSKSGSQPATHGSAKTAQQAATAPANTATPAKAATKADQPAGSAASTADADALPTGKAPPPAKRKLTSEKPAEKPAESPTDKPAEKPKDAQLNSLGGRL
jgi:eukaryotic-like serine/threonine-protein kinase